MSLEQFHDTIAAIATAQGRGALAIVRIAGADALAILSRIVSDPEALLSARGGTAVYTSIRDEDLASIDDVIIHIYRAPRSFTGEDLCEITCHGSPVIASQILELLIGNSARQAEAGEFSRRAFFNGKIGIDDAELISVKANAQATPELRGAALAIAEKYDRLRLAYDGVLTLIARVDAEIDFGDSDAVVIPDFEDRLAEVSNQLDELLRDSANRRENAGYFTVALTGPPNVGKSSIFNALLNFERSIVSELPGTTRDYVEAFIDLDGFRVKLVDTAGIRSADEFLEAKGIALGAAAARHADIEFRVTDPADRSPKLTNGSILLHNKMDLDGWGRNLRLSALTGEGISALHGWLSDKLREYSSEYSRIRLSEAERSLVGSVISGLAKLNSGMEAALISEELRLTSSKLANLLGLNVGSDSLNYIFARMCIGK